MLHDFYSRSLRNKRIYQNVIFLHKLINRKIGAESFVERLFFCCCFQDQQNGSVSEVSESYRLDGGHVACEERWTIWISLCLSNQNHYIFSTGCLQKKFAQNIIHFLFSVLSIKHDTKWKYQRWQAFCMSSLLFESELLCQNIQDTTRQGM